MKYVTYHSWLNWRVVGRPVGDKYTLFTSSELRKVRISFDLDLKMKITFDC
jgi:hypothetical protein